MENKLFTCAEAKEIDLVDYLFSLGFKPTKIRNNDYWYLSPLRDETEASFKVNRRLNIWYDFGIGKGGNLIDFGTLYYKCSISALLEKLKQNSLSFHPQQSLITNNSDSFLKRSLKSAIDCEITADEKKIKIVSVKTISNPSLCRYLHERRIPLDIVNLYCKEVLFEMNDKNYYAVGFKNNSRGYELRNQFFKGSSSPKDVTLIDNGEAKEVAVFEGFFSFLSYQSINKNQEQSLANLPVRQIGFLILNSLTFFEKSKPLLENHACIHLFLDRDKAGLKQTKEALKMSHHYKDESTVYKGYKDMNDWLTGKRMVKEQRLHHRRGL